MAGKTGITPEELQRGELYGVLDKARGEAKPLGPDIIAQKIRAAEDWIEHEANVRFGTQRIVCEPQRRGIASTDYDREEAPYDFQRDMLLDERWGYFELRERPVVQIDRFFFRFPGTTFSQTFNIVPDWIRLEKQFGHVQIVPSSGTGMTIFALQAFVASILGTGRGVPQALYVDYQAGLSREALCRDHQDLLEAVRIAATLFLFGILDTIRSGGLASQSLSQDGQSRSQSPASGKWGAYSGRVEMALANLDRVLNTWRRHERGILFAVA